MLDRGVSALGIVVLLGIAALASTNRRAIRWRPVAAALLLQLVMALLVLETELGRQASVATNGAAAAFIAAADVGIDFLFGQWPGEVLGSNGQTLRLPYVFAVRVLPVLIFMSSVFAVLFHLGLLQFVVRKLAAGLRRILPISGAESLATIANIFLGQTEAPLMIRPYVAGLTRSELFCVMTAGMATVAGSVLVAYMGMLGPELASHLVAASFMSAPAAIAVAKLMIPEEEVPLTSSSELPVLERETVNIVDAAATGASDGMRLALNVGAMLIAFVALVALLNAVLSGLGGLFGVQGLTFEWLLGHLLAPLAWLLGVPWEDATAVGQMLGVKTVLNEFIAYQQLAELKASLHPRSAVIASYALCGFANFSSMAILIGGLGSIAPERRTDVARDALRAVLGGSLASFQTGAVAGLVLG